MKIDWASYVDESMAEDARNEIRARMALDEPLRAEYLGYIAFLKEVRDQGSLEVVPITRLEHDLSRVAPTKPEGLQRRKWFLRLSPVFFAAAALAWLPYALPGPTKPANICDPLGIVDVPLKEFIATNSAEEVKDWLCSINALSRDKIELGGMATVTGARNGNDWVRYDFYARGVPFYVYVASTDKFAGYPEVKYGKLTFFRLAHGVGWRYEGLSYYIEGCDEQFQLSAGSRIRSEIATQSKKRLGIGRVKLS